MARNLVLICMSATKASCHDVFNAGHSFSLICETILSRLLEIRTSTAIQVRMVMFHRYHNLRRAVGLLGVVLALSSTAQRTQVFCVLAGCSVASACDTEVHRCTCSHSCHQNESKTAPLAHDCCHDEADSSLPAECPCPDSCWCHQSPEPFELPKTPSQPHELLLTSLVNTDATLTSVLLGEQSARTASLVALDSSTATSAQLCSELCRFLI